MRAIGLVLLICTKFVIMKLVNVIGILCSCFYFGFADFRDLVLPLLSLTLRSIARGNDSAFLRVDTIQREMSDTEWNFDLDKLHVFIIGPHCSVGIVDGWPGTI